MPAPQQVIAATLPATPTAVPVIPAPPSSVVPLPSAPLIVIDGKRVPVIPSFAAAAVAGLGMLVMSLRPAVTAAGRGAGLGLLTAALSSSQPSDQVLGGAGTSAAWIAIGPGGGVVVTASFGSVGRAFAGNAAYAGMGGLSAETVPNPGGLPSFFANGSATATVGYPASFTGAGTAGGTYSQSVSLVEAGAADGIATATVTVKGSAVVAAHFGAAGSLSAASVPRPRATVSTGGLGALSARTGVPALPAGTGTLSAAVGIPALFGSIGSDTATVVVPAGYTGGGGFTAAAVVRANAAFGGVGGLAGAQRAAAFAGAGALSATAIRPTAFMGTGTASAATGGRAQFGGAGTLSIAVASGFNPSGMTKSGTFPLSSSWQTIPSWTADTATYAGSTVSGNGLVAQGTKSGATLTANIPFASGSFNASTTVRILVNGTLIATGSAVEGVSGTASCTATATVATGDIVTVQGMSTGITSTTVSAGTGTYVRIT
ncbi:hypothetical protein [Nocardia gipuzkoensis]|uniref:hypothetical protein n=1 Tax=Nocardia gipuzkoensis TaxID=2749991 RepID=UPI003EE209E6